MMDRLAVVVDGSNVIHANLGSKKYFSVNRVKNVIEKLKKLGYTYQRNEGWNIQLHYEVCHRRRN
jgi:hypothetical protein